MRNKFILLSVVVFGLMGCAKWFNKDITDDTVNLLSPPNNQTDSLLNKEFWWDELNGAQRYQLQIVSPNFDSIVTLVLDSVIEDNVFSIQLNSGAYQWRVRGLNNGFESKWKTRSFTILSTASLNGQEITSLSPQNGFTTADMNVNFSWRDFDTEEYYVFTIKDNSESTIVSQNIESNSFSYTFNSEGIYTWSVQALNSFGASIMSNYTITIDTTSPASVTYTQPSTDTIRSFPYNFIWSKPVDNGSSISEKLQIASDAQFQTILLDTIVTGESISLQQESLGNNQNYFWRITCEDAAGNTGSNSSSATFRIEL